MKAKEEQIVAISTLASLCVAFPLKSFETISLSKSMMNPPSSQHFGAIQQRRGLADFEGMNKRSMTWSLSSD